MTSLLILVIVLAMIIYLIGFLPLPQWLQVVLYAVVAALGIIKLFQYL